MCGRYALNLAPASAVTAAVAHGATWADPGDALAYAPRNSVNPTTHAPVAFRVQPQAGRRIGAAGATHTGKTGSAARVGANVAVGANAADDAAAGDDAGTSAGSATTSSSPALTSSEGEVVVRFMRWGLVPSYMQREQITQNPPLINARSETVLEKPSFRAIKSQSGSRRCVVITSGYYEWFSYPDPPGPARGRPPPKKLPYLIHSDQVAQESATAGEADGALEAAGRKSLLLAGLYDLWQGGGNARNADRDDFASSFAILTMDSNQQISWLHTRMPVVLETEHAVRTWLDPACPPETACKVVLAESSNTKHLAWTRVTKDLSAPLPPEEQGKPKPPTKLAAIDSFFSSPRAKSGHKRAGDASALSDDAPEREDRKGDGEHAGSAKKARKEPDERETTRMSQEDPSAEMGSSTSAGGTQSPGAVTKVPVVRGKEKPGSEGSPVGRPRAKLKDGKQRSISDFFKPK